MDARVLAARVDALILVFHSNAFVERYVAR